VRSGSMPRLTKSPRICLNSGKAQRNASSATACIWLPNPPTESLLSGDWFSTNIVSLRMLERFSTRGGRLYTDRVASPHSRRVSPSPSHSIAQNCWLQSVACPSKYRDLLIAVPS